MVTGLDIGNSTVVLGQFNPEYLFPDRIRWETTRFRAEDLTPYIENSLGIAVSCVVDSILPDVIAVAEKSRKKWVVVDQHHSALVDFSDYKSEMGADRVAGVVGAASEYKPPFCIVDMGTALTFSVVDEEYRYRGGLIMPGVTTMFRSLFTFTHKLPTLELEKFPQTLLGLTTQENIQHGIYHLVSGGIQGILTRLKEEYPSLSIIGTGGWANFFNSFFHQVDCDLILKGLRYFYYQSKRGNGC